MPVPSFLEQKHIVAKLDRLLAKVDSCRAHLDRAATAIKRFRQSVLNAAVTGRLTEELAITNQADIDQIQELIFERKTKQKESSEKLEIELDYMLPENWLTAPLSLLMDSCSYGSSKKSEKRGLVPVLRMGNIQSGALDWSDLVYSSDPVEIEKYGLKSGDVLFNRTNSPELVGKSAIYGGGQPKAIFAGYLIRVRASSLLNPQFLTYCLNSSYGRHFSWQVKTDGVSQSNINATKLSALPVPLCSAKEQEAIVERAENLFAKANEMSVKLIAARARVDNLTASILAKAFRGELVGNED
ncbi:MAG: restriction endonuclease subunit S [Candidatus Riflebacteria bacterium]|nr:restriction endonuclease subunit S [Candidatus Riflebacteria bacterium]